MTYITSLPKVSVWYPLTLVRIQTPSVNVWRLISLQLLNDAGKAQSSGSYISADGGVEVVPMWATCF